MATILVGISAVIFSQQHERKRTSEEAHRLKKIEIYQAFINMAAQMLGAQNKNLGFTEPDHKELVRYLFKYKTDILLWGSPQVVKAQLHFEATSGGADHVKTFRAVNSLYLATRADIGLSNKGLNNLELVKLSLDDKARLNIH